MNWIICFSIALAVIFLSIIAAAIVSRKNKRSVDALAILASGFFVTSAVLFFPIYQEVFIEELNPIRTTLLSVHNAIRLFVVDADYTFVLEYIGSIDGALKIPYTVFLAIMFVGCPIFTFSLILAFLKNAFSGIRLILNYNSDVYVFLN